MADTAYCPERIGAGTQMAYLTQKLHRMALLLQGIALRVGFAIKHNIFGLHLNGLSGSLRLHQLAVHTDACPRGDAAQQFLVEFCQIHNNLDIINGRTVVQCNESHILVSAFGTHPAFHIDSGVYQLFHTAVKQMYNFNTFHIVILFIFSLRSTWPPSRGSPSSWPTPHPMHISIYCPPCCASTP